MTRANKPVKVIVWDLDNTLWDGTLLEGDRVELYHWVGRVVRELDNRGLLQSIASKNDYELAKSQLVASGLWEFFLYPQIGWDAKSESLSRIAELLNVGVDSLAFIDDQPFELGEVAHRHPSALCLPATHAPVLLEDVRFQPAFITPESALRRKMYKWDEQRKRAEEDWVGTPDAFLESVGLKMEIRRAGEDDLQRAEELTQRTNQLNSTGYSYSYQELQALLTSPEHLLLVSSLEDKYGSYGTIGLALVHVGQTRWTLKLMLMSCRVMSRGVGSVMLNFIMNMARESGVRLSSEFVPTSRNRVMYITYKFAGFEEVGSENGVMSLEAPLTRAATIPAHVELIDRVNPEPRHASTNARETYVH